MDFCHLISAVRFNRQDDSIQIWTQILNLNSIHIENWQNLIQNDQKRTDFVIFVVVFNKYQLFDLLIDFFDYLIDFFDLYIDLLIEIDQIQIENDRDLIEFAIVDSNLSLDFELDQN